MTNAIYTKAKEQMLQAGIDLINTPVKAILVDTLNYSVNLATHVNLTDVGEVARTAISPVLTNKVVTDGIFDADNVTFPEVTGNQSEAIILYLETGLEETSLLIAYIDTATGLPITPNGGDIVIQWDDGANKIFKL